ncbi:FAD-binding domain-containing protein [Thozetella sp. PMI_491]|nr:FAD-binding domain-containing protein [Thozetella sp. PMI_491]
MPRALNWAKWLALVISGLARAEAGLYFEDGQAPLGMADNSTTASCHRVCAQLQATGHAELITHYPDLPAGFAAQFFTEQQRQMVPLCVAQPRSAAAVSLVVRAVTEQRCPFAVKSGGHSVAPGSSCRHDGLLLDLQLLNQVEVSEDRSATMVGPGAKWGDVYKKLEPQGLMVVGGRVASVGVGGFIQGGGISFLSRRHGWALDNVRSFEVVLPNGTVTTASSSLNPDLFFAIRGTGSNFGIVTRFELETYPYESSWGGTNVNFLSDHPERKAALGLQDRFDWTFESGLIAVSNAVQAIAAKLGFGARADQWFTAFLDVTDEAQTDRSAHAFIVAAWVPRVKAYLLGITYSYEQPVENPPALQNVTSIPTLDATARLAPMSAFAEEIEGQSTTGSVGDRIYWRTVSFKVNRELPSKLWDIFVAETFEYRLAVPESTPSLNMQVLGKHEIALFSRNGGNALGVDVEDGPLLFFGIATSYVGEKNDELVKKMVDRIIDRAMELGKEMGVYHPFFYSNYETPGQHVYAGLAPKTRLRLLELQQSYDPGRVFADLQPGHLWL